ncbi:hypothetical protein [Phenylobacterium sp.]|uniref:hypothetical protein n=1 Tax=Phenylobacterium sp. TaxID=1871053 RepID=UPI002F40C914
MNEAHPGGSGASCHGAGATAPGAADWLRLAAAPTFAIMALLTGILGAGRGNTLCAGGQDAPALGGMLTMYLLMSAFHSAPWLKLISGQRGGIQAD